MRVFALSLVALCTMLVANAPAEGLAPEELLAEAKKQAKAKDYEAAGEFLGRFLRDHYESELVADALLTSAFVAFSLGSGKDAHDLVTEARVWGAKIPRGTGPRYDLTVPKSERGRWVPPDLYYWRQGIPEREGEFPFSFSKRPEDARLYVVGRAAFTVADKPLVNAAHAYKCAIDAYEKLLREHPGSKYAAGGAQDLPVAYARTKQRDQAWEALAGLAKLDPAHEAATAEGMVFHRAMLETECLVRQRADQTNMPIARVVAPLDAALASAIGSNYVARATCEKGRVLEKLGETAGAQREYEEVFRRWPREDVTGDALARLGQLEYRRGRELQKQKAHATRLTGGSGVTPRSLDRFRAAARHFAQVPKLHPKHKLAGKCGILAGQCWMRAEDYAEAADAFRAIVDQAGLYAPDIIAETLYWLGDSLTKHGNHEEAYRAFKRLARDYPARKWAKYGRARLAEVQFSEFDKE